MKKIFAAALPVMLITLLFTACGSSSRITSSWKADQQPAQPLKKVLVLGLFSDKDRGLRLQIEEELARMLQTQGLEVVKASDTYGPKSFQNMKEEVALKKLKDVAVDGVVTVTLLDKDKEKKYVPGSVAYAPYPYMRRGFWGYYSYYYPRIYEPGYYETSTSYFFETNLYNVNNNDLLYSAQSKSFDPSSTSSLADNYARSIVKDMKKNGVFTGPASQ